MQRITRDHTNCLFSRELAPVATVESGEELVFETWDAAGGRLKTEADALSLFLKPEQANPASGPVFVRGAQTGDTLAVDILSIKLAPRGHSRIKPGAGVIISELKPPVARLIHIDNGEAIFSPTIRFPVRPMVGVIGVAPAGEAVASYYPGPHGGNMDINDVAAGARLHLPVAVAGALLAIGDVHASMGDGELTGGGIDIPAEVTVRVEVLKGWQRPRPWLETPDLWVTIGNAPALADAIRQATSDMATLLAEKLAISREEAFILIGARGDARPGQCAELGMDATARVAFPRLR